MPLRTALSVEQGFAFAYAMVAIGESPEYLLPQASDEIALALLRGMRAARLRDESRRRAMPSRLDCATLDRLPLAGY
jgi:hypothetical protein